MRVLEIKGFMYFPRNYEGKHRVIRWASRNDEGGEGKKTGALSVLREGLRLVKAAPSLEIDLIICQGFGVAYGGKKGGRFLWLRHWSKSLYERLLIQIVGLIKKRAGVPLAVVDIADDPSIHPVNESLLELAEVYYKRELPLDPYHAFESLRKKANRSSALMDRRLDRWNQWVEKLEPISLGCAALEPSSTKFISEDEKKWDVFYSGGEAYKPRRKGIMASLRSLESRGFRVRTPEAPLDIEEYLTELSRARLAISPPGLGWECHRHYEAAFVGAVVVTPYPTIRRYAPLLNEEQCLFYDPEKELGPQIEEMLRDPSRLRTIARNAREHVHQHHSFEQIFDHVVTRTLARGAKSRR